VEAAIARQKKQRAIAQRKAAALDRLEASEGSFSMTVAAKI